MIFTIKRILKDIPFLVLLACVIIVPIIAFKTGENIKTPPFGYVCDDSSDDAARLCKELDNAGFVRCSDADELEAEISAAHLDCGVIFNGDISKRMESGDFNESVLLITSAETVMPELCRISTVSALSMVYSPYVTYEALQKAVSIDRTKQVYYDMVDSGQLFTFEIKSASGLARLDNARSRNLFKGALSILIFITLMIGICRPSWRHKKDMQTRFGHTKAFFRVCIPEFLIRTALLIIISVITCLIMGQTDLIRAAAIYTISAGVAGLILTVLLSDAAILVLTVFITILSLGLCPMFTDLAELIPAVTIIRKFLIPYMLWIL